MQRGSGEIPALTLAPALPLPVEGNAKEEVLYAEDGSIIDPRTFATGVVPEGGEVKPDDGIPPEYLSNETGEVDMEQIRLEDPELYLKMTTRGGGDGEGAEGDAELDTPIRKGDADADNASEVRSKRHFHKALVNKDLKGRKQHPIVEKGHSEGPAKVGQQIKNASANMKRQKPSSRH